MIAIIRISGDVKRREEIKETLYRLGLKNKYTCIIINEKDKEKIGMLKKVKDYVAFGEIDKQTLIRLIEKRLDAKNKKINAEKIANEFESGKLHDSGIKLHFRLNSPKGGLKSSKKQFPRGVLGNHKKEISKLIDKMI